MLLFKNVFVCIMYVLYVYMRELAGERTVVLLIVFLHVSRLCAGFLLLGARDFITEGDNETLTNLEIHMYRMQILLNITIMLNA